MAEQIFSPLSSWMLIIAVAVVAVGIYFAVSAWLDAYEQDLDRRYRAWLDGRDDELDRMSPEWVDRFRRKQVKDDQL